jgi:hypothetical protein
MAESHTDASLQSLDGARQVLVEVAHNREMHQSHLPISEYCDNTVLHQIVDLAWRHQFSDDRYGFKREIRELQEYVVRRATEAIEATE